MAISMSKPSTRSWGNSSESAPTVQYTASPTAGLHAEMAIVSHVIAKTTNPKSAVWDLGYILEIFCVGKPVCPDCAGWLNKHKVPHLSLIKGKDSVEIQYACGKPSAGGQWVHPRTQALFQSEGNLLEPKLNTWQKSGLSVNRPFGF